MRLKQGRPRSNTRDEALNQIDFFKFIWLNLKTLSAKEQPYSEQLHKGASADTHKRANELRHAETEAEKKLWSLLRNRQLKGKKFRRQHAFTNYILDFYCHECKLAVELDGGHHLDPENKEHDTARTRLLEEYGITVLRFRNYEVLNKPGKVLERIADSLC